MSINQWQPIEPLQRDALKVNLSELDSLQAAWQTVQANLQQSSPARLREFKEKILRSWSIETGIIERLYDLDEGTTQTLVESGFFADLVDRSSTNIEPRKLIAILHDQQDAAEFVVNTVRDERPLNRHFLLEIHSLLTQNQQITEGIDQFGSNVSIPLLRGEFKRNPNNPTRSDGVVHLYAPPVQVVSQIDNLLNWVDEYHGDHPIVVAAWLHHRFTQIHPFQDGNGRVARCLMTLILLRGQWLPLVVTRNRRPEYIVALEMADNGDLNPLVKLFAELEQEVLIQAVSSAGAPELLPKSSGALTSGANSQLIDQVAASIAQRLQMRKSNELTELRRVNEVAARLLEDGKIFAQDFLSRTTQALNQQSATLFEALPLRDADEGGPHLGEREHYFHSQIVETARIQGHWVNLNEARYWFRCALRETNSQLTIVSSFHHIGRDLTGVMQAVCFAQITYFDEEGNEREDIPCTMRPFTFTWNDDADAVSSRFTPWLNECFAIALRIWGESL